MTNNTLKKISENPNLISFCNKILSYNVIFENEITRNMFFASLTNTDALIDEQSCIETIEIATFILNNINLFILEDDIKRLVEHYSENSIFMAKNMLKNFYEICNDYK